MDNARAASWAPSAGLVVTAWLAAAVALAWLVFADDTPGRLLAAIGMIGLAAAALFGTVARPRLSVDERLLAVRGLTGAVSWPWQQVHRVHVVRHRRLGRDIAMLEIDIVDPEGDERLLVLGRLDLNADPDDVLATINEIRSR